MIIYTGNLKKSMKAPIPSKVAQQICSIQALYTEVNFISV